MIDRKQDIKQLVSTIESLHKQHEGDMEIIRVLVEQHERDQEELSAIRQELVLSRKETETCNQTIRNMADDLAVLRRMLFGTSSEKTHREDNSDNDGKQGGGSHDNDSSGVGIQSESENPEVLDNSENLGDPEHPAEQKKPARKTHPAKRDYSDIPVNSENIIELKPDDKTIEGARLMKTEAKYLIYYHPGYLFKVLQKRYIYTKDGKVIKPDLPWVPDELQKRRCHATLVAGILVNKFQFHIPYERQLQMLNSGPIKLAKSTLINYGKVGIDALDGLYYAIRDKVLSSDRVNIDETVQYIVDPENHKTRNGYDWGFVSPQYKMMYFVTKKGSRAAEVLDAEIKEYKGRFIQNDGYITYENVSKRTRKELEQVFCMAHIRRKFWDSIQYHKKLAEEALYYIERMFLLERLYRERRFKPDEIVRRRSKYLRFLLDRFKAWLEKVTRENELSDQSNIGKAVNYAKERIDSFYVLCKNGLLELSNNLAERCMRGHTLGRKNYLFVQNDESAERTCKIYTIIESCKMCGIDPFKYLVTVLTKSPEECMTYDELLPCNIEL